MEKEEGRIETSDWVDAKTRVQKAISSAIAAMLGKGAQPCTVPTLDRINPGLQQQDVQNQDR